MSLADALSGIDTLNLIALGAVVSSTPSRSNGWKIWQHTQGWRGKAASASGYCHGRASVGFWFVAPAISFIIFLAISMFHFGKGDVNDVNKQFMASEFSSWWT